STTPVQDSIQKTRVNMLVRVDKGEKVKVKNINISGNRVLSDAKLRKAMKNTKQKNPIRLFKRSKYIEADYKEDLSTLLDKYKENGYRDARILSDSIVYNKDNTISINLNLEEGEKYTFGNISFIGNTVYTYEQLNRVLRIKERYNYFVVFLEHRIVDNTVLDADDITNLYQCSWYVFSTINLAEVNDDGIVLDIEVRISEGNPSYFNQLSVVGIEKTH